jgi:hypothetical protein
MDLGGRFADLSESVEDLVDIFGEKISEQSNLSAR